MECDLCAEKLTRNARYYSPREIRIAVWSGFRPLSFPYRLYLGEAPSVAEGRWTNDVSKKENDSLVCQTCEDRVETVLSSPPHRGAQPVQTTVTLVLLWVLTAWVIGHFGKGPVIFPALAIAAIFTLVVLVRAFVRQKTNRMRLLLLQRRSATPIRRLNTGQPAEVQNHTSANIGRPAARNVRPVSELFVEMDNALDAIRRARALGRSGADRPLRSTGIQVMTFVREREQEYRTHVELLLDLVGRGLLTEFGLWKLDLGGEEGFSGLLFVTGSAEAVMGYSKHTYYLREAEQFVARRCANDWSKIESSDGVSDLPAPGCAVDLRVTEKALGPLVGLARARVDRIEAIGGPAVEED